MGARFRIRAPVIIPSNRLQKSSCRAVLLDKQRLETVPERWGQDPILELQSLAGTSTGTSSVLPWHLDLLLSEHSSRSLLG